MKSLIRKLFAASLLGVGITAISPHLRAEDPPQGVEVLARGPVHEAFAATLEIQTGAPLTVAKAPPDAIEELPPDQKPAGDNVQWIPGYWHWDEERTDFIWISGFWRVPPPNRVWVAGSWREARTGFHWVHGFWQEARVERSEIEYLPPPPAAIEVAPSIPAPSETHVYVPGSWVWRNRYVYRPGVWIDHNPGWIWVSSHYRWTPAGYIFIDGYWDFPLADRGILYAPVYVQPAVYYQPAFVYTPVVVVNVPCLFTSLFVRRGYGSYYFGDYYENRYTQGGYRAWCGNNRGSSFAVNVGFGRGYGYDPMWDYYRISYRNDRNWAVGVTDVYAGRYNGSLARPPRTLVQQNTVINNITNVTNVTNNVTNNTNTNTVVVNTNKTVNNNTMLLTTVNNVQQTNQKIALKPLAKEDRVQEQKFAQDLRGVSAQRKQLETNLADRSQVANKIDDKPRTVKIDVPKAAVFRAQVAEEQKTKIPPPTAATLVGSKNSPPALKPTAPAPVTNAPTVIAKPETKPLVPMQPGVKTDTKPLAPPAGIKPEMKPGVPVTPIVKPLPAPAPAPLPSPKPMPVPVPQPAPKPIPAPAPAPKPFVPPPATQPAPKPAPVFVAPPAPVFVAPPAPKPAPVFVPPPAPAPKPAPVFVPPPAPKPAPQPAFNPPPPVSSFKPAAPVFTPAPALKPAPQPASPDKKDKK